MAKTTPKPKVKSNPVKSMTTVKSTYVRTTGAGADLVKTVK
jgi:hypothetical protein